MLNLERLRTLDAVARHGSVSGAADGLHVTTSAVSQQLSKLEREVGQRLLAKNGRGVRLTDAGLLLAQQGRCYTFAMFTARKPTRGSQDRGAWPWRA